MTFTHKDIIKAVKVGDLELVKQILANGRTPLQETGLHNAFAVAKLLREHGAV